MGDEMIDYVIEQVETYFAAHGTKKRPNVPAVPR